MSRAKRLCRLWGHAWETDAAEYYRVYYCERCGHEGEACNSWRERFSVKLRVWMRCLRELARASRQWVRCRECGRWLGNHDDRFDHVPF